MSRNKQKIDEIPRLPDSWYDQLQDPPEPPERELTSTIVITLNDDAVIGKSFPSGEDLGEAPEAPEASEATSI